MKPSGPNSATDIVDLAPSASELPASGVYRAVFKRLFDLCFALLLLPILVPVILGLWIMARRDGGPGFYGHARVGKNGVMFKCWKVRSMCLDSQEQLRLHLEANPEAAREWALTQKLKDDPRITAFGNFIRKTSLDELPQIWNVLRGQMSFVGPRPVVQDELNKYGPFQSTYLELRPGITGIWQTSGRNEVDYDDRVRFDVEYLQSMTFLGDLKLILKTATVVFDRTGH